MFSTPIHRLPTSFRQPLTPQSQSRNNSLTFFSPKIFSPSYSNPSGKDCIALFPLDTPRFMGSVYQLDRTSSLSNYALGRKDDSAPIRTKSLMASEDAFDRRKQNQSNPLELLMKPNTSDKIRRQKLGQGVKERREANLFQKRNERRQQLDHFTQQRAWEEAKSREAPPWTCFDEEDDVIHEENDLFYLSAFAQDDIQMAGADPCDETANDEQQTWVKDNFTSPGNDGPNFKSIHVSLSSIERSACQNHSAQAHMAISSGGAESIKAYEDQSSASENYNVDSEDEAAFEAELLNLVREADKMDVSSD